MENKGIFKTSIMGGFEKESVLGYLEELNSNNTKLLEEKQSEIDCLEKEKFQKEEEIDSLLAQMEELHSVLSQEREENKDLETDVLNLTIELEKSKQQARKFENENILLAEKHKQLQNKHDSLTQKEHSFNDASVKLGSLLLEAQKTAESIVQNANSKAEDIKKETKREVRDTICKLEVFKGDFETMKSDIQNVLTTMGSKMNEIEVSVDSTLKKSKKIVVDGTHNKQPAEKQNQECRKTIKV